ncbi:hypothetical protein GOODEAATRI_020068 [Goodea atripinnis]|uniref:Uncharacterized protein n=1 Tax=Goodea atripinnis TaxID=208336 RepID=A0ABV0MTL0_9TELE
MKRLCSARSDRHNQQVPLEKLFSVLNNLILPSILINLISTQYLLNSLPLPPGAWVAQVVAVCSVRLSRCVLGQDTSSALPTDGGQRVWWCQLYGSLASVSLPQGSCGYDVVYHCQCVDGWMNGWMTDCSVKCAMES